MKHRLALAPGKAARYTIAGTLCTPSVWADGKRAVDILVHGGTYDQTYWDFPVKPAFYSYVRRTLRAGRATFAYDRLGVGGSDRPLSLRATMSADAYILHQLVQWLRDQQYDKITVIGHSLGSLVAMNEANGYTDVDGLVITGMLHTVGAGASLFTRSVHLARSDPRFSGLRDFGYFTTKPGTRRPVFYSPAADPAVIAYDEAHKDMASILEVALSSNTLLPPVLSFTKRITAPVLVVVGAQDVLMCGPRLDCNNQAAVLANETPYYRSAASLSALPIPNTGHTIALHPTAGESFAGINKWIEAR